MPVKALVEDPMLALFESRMVHFKALWDEAIVKTVFKGRYVYAVDSTLHFSEVNPYLVEA